MFGIGATELVIIGIMVLVFFGAAKIPELARSLGRAKAEYHRATTQPPEPQEEVARK